MSVANKSTSIGREAEDNAVPNDFPNVPTERDSISSLSSATKGTERGTLGQKSRKVIRKNGFKSSRAVVCCPICSRRFPISFIQIHASSCSIVTRPGVRKRKKTASATKSWLHPRYPTILSPSAQPSEVGAAGFQVFPDVFSDVEMQLLQAIEAVAPPWTNYVFRQTKNYGPAYNLRGKRFLFGKHAPREIPLPSYAKETILPRLKALTPILNEFQPNQLSVGLYVVPGDSHILPHNDCENGHIGTAVVGVCLAASCTMTLILRSRFSGEGHEIKRDVRLPRGAVYVMSGDALRVWEHAIFPGKTEATRYSLTFRDVSPRDAGSQTAFQNVREKRFVQSRLT